MSATLLPEIQYRVPDGAIALEPKTCENCRRGFYRKKGSKAKHCTPCEVMYEAAYADSLYQCQACLTARTYGNGRPADYEARRLKCSWCSEVTEHNFVRVLGGVQRTSLEVSRYMTI